MKKAFLKMIYRGGGFAPFHRLTGERLLILTYHRFSRRENPFAVTCEQLAAHLEYLAKYRKIYPLAEISARLRDGAKLPEKAAVITIDDGYRDAFEIAFPVLKKAGVPATLFAVTEFLDGKIWVWTDKMRYLAAKMKSECAAIEIGGARVELNRQTPEKVFQTAARANSILKKIPDAEKEKALKQAAHDLKIEIPELPPEEFAPVSWKQAREMDASNVAVESHTATHPILPNVEGGRLNDELCGSKRRLEEMLDREVKFFCYPAGGVDDSVARAVERNGYECAVTTRYGFNEAGVKPFLLKRIDAQPGAADFAQSASGFEELKARLRR